MKDRAGKHLVEKTVAENIADIALKLRLVMTAIDKDNVASVEDDLSEEFPHL